jgi:diamine N-acetyltransferase
MHLLKGENIKLRALELQDIEFLYKWENDTSIWQVSNTVTPVSRLALEQYLETAQYDIYTTKQLRLVIENFTPDVIGCIDLFDFDPNNRRAGIGVLVAENGHRNKGCASEALKLLIEYSFSTLGLKQLYCNVELSNEASLGLFKKFGFEIVGVKKQWLRSKDGWDDEYMLQLINDAG